MAQPILWILPMENHWLLLWMPSQVSNPISKDSTRSLTLSHSENQIQLQKTELSLCKSDGLCMYHKGKPLLLHSEYWRQSPALPGAHPPGSLPWKNGHSLLRENHEPKLNGVCNYIKTNETPIWNSILFSQVIGHASTT